MSFALSDLSGVFTKVQHNITDEAAESLIDDAVAQAGVEIRNYARQLRATEMNLKSYYAACDERQNVLSANIRAGHEAEMVNGQRRQDELRAAEAINGPRRGGY